MFNIKYKYGVLRILIRSLLIPPPPKGRFLKPNGASKTPNGLLAIGGAVTPETLLEALRKGIFAYYYNGTVRWWSPDPRMVLFPENLKIQQGLRRVVKQQKFRVTFDEAYDSVIIACSNREKTWITRDIIDSFKELHNQGFAHSVEVWNNDNKLVGGLYGIALGKIFFTESLFFIENNASKVAFMYLNCHLQHWGFVMNDLQFKTDHWERQGCVPVPRDKFLHLLNNNVNNIFVEDSLKKWKVDPSLNVGIWEPKKAGSQL